MHTLRTLKTILGLYSRHNLMTLEKTHSIDRWVGQSMDLPEIDGVDAQLFQRSSDQIV